MFLYGASGHAKVIIEILEKSGVPIDGIFDDNESIRLLLKYSVQKFQEEYAEKGKFIISIGNNDTRRKIALLLHTQFGIAIHPSSVISERTVIGEGSVVMGGVTVNADSKTGKHCIINTNSSVDHDCILEDFVHISPNVALCGDVQVGEGTHVGVGAVVIPGKKIGKWCTIGAGSVINMDIPSYAVVVGNPGRIIKYHNPLT